MIKFLLFFVLSGILGLTIYIIASLLYLTFHFWTYNQTTYSSKFSWVKWSNVSQGMSKEEVVNLLGSPLKLKPAWGCTHNNQMVSDCTAELWAHPENGYGYFAQVDFVNQKVITTKYWRDD